VKAVAASTMGVNNGAFSGIAAGNVFIVQVKMDLCSVWERWIGYNYPCTINVMFWVKASV